MYDIMPMCTLPTESNLNTVKHTAGGVTLHKNMFGVRFDPSRCVSKCIRPDEEG